MRTAVVLLLGAYLWSPSAVSAQEGRHPLLRRLTLAVSCAASIWDVQTTAAAIARGGRESNGLFTDAQGRPRWGRMIGLKVGMCGVLAVAQETKLMGQDSRFKDNLWIGSNIGLSTRFTVSAIRNLSVAGDLSPNAPWAMRSSRTGLLGEKAGIRLWKPPIPSRGDTSGESGPGR